MYSPSAETTSKLVEVAEVDRNAWGAVPVPRRNRIDHPIGPDLARVVVADRNPRLRAGPDDEDRRLRPALGEELELTDERGHGRGQADPVDRLQVEQLPEERAELIASPARLGREPPLLGQPVAVVEAEDRLRVADVDRQEHGPSLLQRERRDAPVLVDPLIDEALRVDPVREEVTVVVGALDCHRRHLAHQVKVHLAVHLNRFGPTSFAAASIFLFHLGLSMYE